mmetsp:Transcript_31859/g.77378  ORF Transcript_31859/g.77378 Transcript_31859/m.77378 type:complete len:112 (-) Transcript_31859:423-758(-)
MLVQVQFDNQTYVSFGLSSSFFSYFHTVRGSFSDTTIPLLSQTIQWPGWKVTPPNFTGMPTCPSFRFSVLRGCVPNAKTPSSCNCCISSMSRMKPYIKMPSQLDSTNDDAT